MDITFVPNQNGSNILQINNAKITWCNFSGREEKFNREGKRYFHLIIPDQEVCDALLNDKNQYGEPWNVKIKPPRNEGDEPFMHLKVNVSFKGRGCNAYLKTGDKLNRLDEESIDILDDVEMLNVDLDIRPYDDVFNDKPFRSAYLHSICVTQDLDRFAEQYASEEYPEEY